MSDLLCLISSVPHNVSEICPHCCVSVVRYFCCQLVFHFMNVPQLVSSTLVSIDVWFVSPFGLF